LWPIVSQKKALTVAAWKDEGMEKIDSDGSNPLGLIILRFAENAAVRYGNF
jgi:hypothetical protein